MKSLKDILAEPPYLSPALKKDWARQKRTAEEVARRFQDGKRIILVADEVGMGKTYVALALMARHIFQTDKNDRKVLLVVPTSSVLAVKWEQEILTFNKTYLPKADGRKQLRPLVVRDYWELVQNLHDYDNVEVERVTQGKIEYFACLFRDWYNDNIRKPKKQLKNWKACGETEKWTPDFLHFCSSISPKIVENFLSDWFMHNPRPCQVLIGELDGGITAPEKLKTLLRDFSRQQDLYEPNVFIISMGMLQRRSRKDQDNMQLLCTYIVGRLMKHVRSKGKTKGYAQLKSCGRFAGIGRGTTKWLHELAQINLWGLKAMADRVIGESKNDLQRRFFKNDPAANNKLLSWLKDEILRRKLGESGISLAVVDEVHNWKSGKTNGAEEFRKNYAPIIENKLIMSATPFQIHENELETVFRIAAGEEMTSRKDSRATKEYNDESMGIVAGLMSEGGLAKQCLAASQAFSEAWKCLPKSQAAILSDALAADQNVADSLRVLRDDGLPNTSLHRFCKTALEYRDALDSFETELQKVTIRHTKDKTIRHFHSGQDFTIQGAPAVIAPRNVLYATPGYGHDGGGALLDFIGMRAQQRIRKALGENGSVRLLGGMNSSHEAFLDSWGARNLKISCDPDTQAYTDFFAGLLGSSAHPKVCATVERAVSNYRRGRKTLVFCERRKTQAAIEARINQKLKAYIPDFDTLPSIRAAILRNFETMEYYLSRSIIEIQETPVFLDDIQESAVKQCLDLLGNTGYGDFNSRQRAKLVDLCLVQVLFKNTPYAAYTGILYDASARQIYLRIKQKRSAEEDTPPVIEEDDEAYRLAPERKQGDADPAPAEIKGIIKNILTGGSIWHPFDAAKDMHSRILSLLDSEAQQLTGGVDAQNLPPSPSALAELLLQIPQGLRSVLLRLDTLSGINPNASDLGEIMLECLRKSISEATSAWQDTEEFVRLLCEAQGSIRLGAQASRRYSLWRGVFLKGQEIVQSLNGDTAPDTRVNLCAAFNSSLLPGILLCTSVGSEGIDLHLQCAEVIHHDLPWNPAKLEQRTGRVDRVGSLAERSLAAHPQTKINIGIPFLACNYDEFQYNTVWSRAQKQEVLLGEPDYPTSVEEESIQNPDSPESVIEPEPDEGFSPDNHESRLPEALLNFLKVGLALA
jgi:superfamily II DNA or RNA helicase